MKKFWLIFWHEYLRHVKRKRFIFALLSLPLIAAATIGIGFLAVVVEMDSSPVGFVLAPEIIPNPQPLPAEEGFSIFKTPPVQFYDSEDAALADLKAKILQAYFVLDPNYLQNGQATLVANENPGDNVRSDFGDFLRFNLLRNQPPDVINRLNEGNTFTVRSLDGRETDENNFATFLMPLLTGLIFIVVINISGGYLLQAVVEEKENRTMEIMVTSASPSQIMSAKTAGNLSVGITQLVVWIVFITLAFSAAKLVFPALAKVNLDLSFIPLMLAVLLPAFVMIGALMATLGATATEAREAQQWAGLFTLPLVMPYWLVTPIMYNPNGGLAVGLSLFPLTAPVTLPLRAAFTTVPFWQIALSISLLILTAAAALWVAGRAFRMGMLRYGKRISLKELFSKAQA